ATLDEVAASFARICRRSDLRRRDVSVDLDKLAEVERLLVKNPIPAWTSRQGASGRPYFTFDGATLRTGPGIRPSESPEEAVAFVELVSEIVEWRIAQYFVERSSGVRLEVLRNESGIPVLELDRNRHDLPEQGAWVDVEIEGQQYSVNFDEERVQVAVPRGQGSQSNALPDLMYKWFGRDAGARGTRFAVAQDAAPGGGYRWTPANSLAGKPSEGTFIRREDGTTVDARMFVEELDGA